MIIRPAVVAGQFYPDEKDELYELIHRCFTGPLGPGRFPSAQDSNATKEVSRVECILVPHAGLIYSGPVAAFSYQIAFDFFQQFKKAKEIIVIILGPNHYGIGSGVAISGADLWETPLGRLKVAKDARKIFASKSTILDIDDLAHSREHSIEVQLPFIQAMAGSRPDKISLLPISLMLQDMATALDVSKALFDLVRESDSPYLVIGSSDLTHYEPHDRAEKQDKSLLAEIAKIDVSGLYTILERKNISACGYGAIASVMQLSKKLGRKSGELLRYATSGETSGDKSSVVGYSSVHFV